MSPARGGKLRNTAGGVFLSEGVEGGKLPSVLRTGGRQASCLVIVYIIYLTTPSFAHCSGNMHAIISIVDYRTFEIAPVIIPHLMNAARAIALICLLLQACAHHKSIDKFIGLDRNGLQRELGEPFLTLKNGDTGLIVIYSKAYVASGPGILPGSLPVNVSPGYAAASPRIVRRSTWFYLDHNGRVSSWRKK